MEGSSEVGAPLGRGWHVLEVELGSSRHVAAHATSLRGHG